MFLVVSRADPRGPAKVSVAEEIANQVRVERHDRFWEDERWSDRYLMPVPDLGLTARPCPVGLGQTFRDNLAWSEVPPLALRSPDLQQVELAAQEFGAIGEPNPVAGEGRLRNQKPGWADVGTAQ
jgi:hypothetical protein